MASTEQQIDDAVAKRHIQNTDSALGSQSADLDMNLHKVIGLKDPTGDKDAAHKKYVDDHGGGGGGGDVTGPGSAIDSAIPLFDGITGKLLKDSARLIEDVLSDGSDIPDGHAIKTYGDANWTAGSGNVNTFGSPLDNDFAKFTDPTHIEGRSYCEVRADLNIEDGATADQDANEIVSLINAGAGLIDDDNIAASIARDTEVDAKVSDVIYGAGWNGVTGIAPSKNAIYDKIESMGIGYTNLTQFVDQTAWRLFYSNAAGDVTELALGTSGQYLKANGVGAVPTWSVPGGAGNVVGPATNTDNYVPQWNGADSKTLKNGFPITAAGKALIDDADAAAQRTTLGLLSAVLRNAEDALTDGGNLPDGHAIKTYGDANWSSGGPGGSNTHIQYNSSGSFGGSSAFIWDNTKKSLIMTTTMTITDSGIARYGSYNNITLSGTQGVGNTQLADWRRMHAPVGQKAWMTGYWIDLFPKVEQVSADANKYDVNGFMVINNGSVKAQSGLFVGGLAGGDVPTTSNNPRGYPWTCGVEIGVGATFGIVFNPFGMNYPSGYEYDIGIDLASYWTGNHPRYYITPILLPNRGHIKALDTSDNVRHLIGLDNTNVLNIGVQTPSTINLGWGATLDSPVCIRTGGLDSKSIEVGNINSGGVNYRILRVLN